MPRGKHFPFLILQTGFPSGSSTPLLRLPAQNATWGALGSQADPCVKGRGRGAQVPGGRLGVPLDHLLFIQVPLRWDACTSCCKGAVLRAEERAKAVNVFATEEDKQYPEPCFCLPVASLLRQATCCLPLFLGPWAPLLVFPFLSWPSCLAQLMG